MSRQYSILTIKPCKIQMISGIILRPEVLSRTLTRRRTLSSRTPSRWPRTRLRPSTTVSLCRPSTCLPRPSTTLSRRIPWTSLSERSRSSSTHSTWRSSDVCSSRETWRSGRDRMRLSGLRPPALCSGLRPGPGRLRSRPNRGGKRGRQPGGPRKRSC
jgi:hypothetical protein